MSKLTVCVGIPASGKSTWSNMMVHTIRNVVRFNRDDVRFMMYNNYWGGHIDEGLITEIQNNAIRSSLRAGTNVIVDNTNLGLTYIKGFKNLAENCGADFETKWFPVDLGEALKRNAARERQVPVDVIAAMHRRYVKISQEFVSDELL